MDFVIMGFGRTLTVFFINIVLVLSQKGKTVGEINNSTLNLDGLRDFEGIVQLKVNKDDWVNICAQNFTEKHAKIICKIKGYHDKNVEISGTNEIRSSVSADDLCLTHEIGCDSKALIGHLNRIECNSVAICCKYPYEHRSISCSGNWTYANIFEDFPTYFKPSTSNLLNTYQFQNDINYKKFWTSTALGELSTNTSENLPDNDMVIKCANKCLAQNKLNFVTVTFNSCQCTDDITNTTVARVFEIIDVNNDTTVEICVAATIDGTNVTVEADYCNKTYRTQRIMPDDLLTTTLIPIPTTPKPSPKSTTNTNRTEMPTQRYDNRPNITTEKNAQPTEQTGLDQFTANMDNSNNDDLRTTTPIPTTPKLSPKSTTNINRTKMPTQRYDNRPNMTTEKNAQRTEQTGLDQFTANMDNSNNDGNLLSTGNIIFVTVGSIVVILVVGTVCCVVYLYRKVKKGPNERTDNVVNNRTYSQRITLSRGDMDEEYAHILDSDVGISGGTSVSYRPPLPSRGEENYSGEVISHDVITLDNYSTPLDTMKCCIQDEYSITYDDPIRINVTKPDHTKDEVEFRLKYKNKSEPKLSEKSVVESDNKMNKRVDGVPGDNSLETNADSVKRVSDYEISVVTNKVTDSTDKLSRSDNCEYELTTIAKSNDSSKKTCLFNEHICLDCLTPEHLKALGVSIVPDENEYSTSKDLSKRFSAPSRAYHIDTDTGPYCKIQSGEILKNVNDVQKSTKASDEMKCTGKLETCSAEDTNEKRCSVCHSVYDKIGKYDKKDWIKYTENVYEKFGHFSNFHVRKYNGTTKRINST
ncbi:hypothetical protein ACF0H5_011619 [Mactra antiquata]